METNQVSVFILCLTIGVSFVNPCMVTYKWLPLTLEQTVAGADIVVFGQEAEHVSSGRWSWGTDAVFHVYCVLKTDDGPAIPERIIVESVRPVHSCMGTWTRLGEVMILALKRTESGNFRWNELGIMQTAKFSPTLANLQTAVRVAGVEAMTIPEGRSPQAQPSCPFLGGYEGEEQGTETPVEEHTETETGKGQKEKQDEEDQETQVEEAEGKKEDKKEDKPISKKNNKKVKGHGTSKEEQDTKEEKKTKKNGTKWQQEEHGKNQAELWGVQQEQGSGELYVQL